MKKYELVREISKQTNTNIDEAEMALNQVIVELVSPKILPKPGKIARYIRCNAMEEACVNTDMAAGNDFQRRSSIWEFHENTFSAITQPG